MNFGMRMVSKPGIDHFEKRTAPGKFLVAFPGYRGKYSFRRAKKRLKAND